MTKEMIYKINAAAAYFYHYNLTQNKCASSYLYEKRKLNSETIKEFVLGAAPDRWNSLINYMKRKGFTIEQLLETNLIRQSSKGTYYDYFRNRIIFPIKDIYGNIIGFGGRKMKEDDYGPKYLNSPEGMVFQKRLNLYGLNTAKNYLSNEPLILCEGYMDCIAMQRAGFKTAVAGLGTALTAEQILLISSLTNNVILAYDNDQAGMTATKKAIELFEEYTDIKPLIVSMTNAKDADEFIIKYGPDTFKSDVLDKPITIFDFEMLYIDNVYEKESKFDKGVNIVISELMKMNI